MAVQILKIAKRVAASSVENVNLVVPITKKFRVLKFEGEGAFTETAAIVVVWRRGDASENIIWSISGSSTIDLSNEMFLDSNGVLTLSISLINNALVPIYLSGRIKIELFNKV